MVKRSYPQNKTHNHLKFFSIKLKNSLKIHAAGFTLIEVMIAMAIVGILASIAIPNFIKYREKARIEVAISEIRSIEKEIVNYVLDNGKLPEDLSEIGMDKVLDPWGRPYNYLRIQVSDEAQDDKGKGKGENGDKGIIGKTRKDHSLVPINSDFDLYSVGKDGRSASPLTAKISQDDIVRANNGGFVDLASNY